jgi:hypothetical protein
VSVLAAPALSASIAEKASRLLVEGRVLIACGENGIVAVVRGDHGVYRLVREPDRWRCLCPARGTCAHVVAVGLVTGIEA